RGGRAEFVDQMLYEHFFHVYVETEKADKGKQFQEFLVFLRGVLKGCLGCFVPGEKSLRQIFDLSLLHAEYLIVDRGEIHLRVGLEIFLRNGAEKGLDIVDGEYALEIINKNQQKQMLSGIFLFFRRGEQ